MAHSSNAVISALEGSLWATAGRNAAETAIIAGPQQRRVVARHGRGRRLCAARRWDEQVRAGRNARLWQRVLGALSGPATLALSDYVHHGDA